MDRDTFSTYCVNEKKNVFERQKSVSINQFLNLNGEWLKFFNKSSVNNDKIKRDFKIFNPNCIGIKMNDYCVFKDIRQNSRGMIDA